MNKLLQELKAEGVTATIKGHTLTISNIPSWRAYCLVIKHKDHITAQAVVRQILAPKPQFKLIKGRHDCPSCRYYNQFWCAVYPSDRGIPAEIMNAGCPKYSPGYEAEF